MSYLFFFLLQNNFRHVAFHLSQTSDGVISQHITRPCPTECPKQEKQSKKHKTDCIHSVAGPGLGFRYFESEKNIEISKDFIL